MLLSEYVDEIVDVICEEKVPVVTTGAGSPGKYMSKFKEAGTRVIPVVSSVALAKMMAREGVDAVIAEGTECRKVMSEKRQRWRLYRRLLMLSTFR